MEPRQWLLRVLVIMFGIVVAACQSTETPTSLLGPKVADTWDYGYMCTHGYPSYCTVDCPTGFSTAQCASINSAIYMLANSVDQDCQAYGEMMIDMFTANGAQTYEGGGDTLANWQPGEVYFREEFWNQSEDRMAGIIAHEMSHEYYQPYGYDGPNGDLNDPENGYHWDDWCYGGYGGPLLRSMVTPTSMRLLTNPFPSFSHGRSQ